MVDLSRLHATDAAGQVCSRDCSSPRPVLFGLGIGRVESIVLFDPDSALPAERFPRGETLAVLIEDVDAAVAAVGSKEATLQSKTIT